MTVEEEEVEEIEPRPDDPAPGESEHSMVAGEQMGKSVEHAFAEMFGNQLPDPSNPLTDTNLDRGEAQAIAAEYVRLQDSVFDQETRDGILMWLKIMMDGRPSEVGRENSPAREDRIRLFETQGSQSSGNEKMVLLGSAGEVAEKEEESGGLLAAFGF